MAKKELKIIINRRCNNRNPFIYSAGSTKGIELHVVNNGAMVRVTMDSKKNTHEDLRYFRNAVLKDAFRKVFFLHALRYDYNLEPHKIIMSIDGDERIYDKETEGFPFLYSMISKVAMGLPDSWKEPELIQRFLGLSKSKSDEDLMSIAVNAFLASKGREYVIDRFTNLWTSMNAYYKYVGSMYNTYIENKVYRNKEIVEQLPAEIKAKGDIIETNLKLVPNKERERMGFLMKCLEPKPESEKLDAGYFNGVEKKKKRAARHKFEEELHRLPIEDRPRLYDYAEELLKGREAKKEDEFYYFHELSQTMGQKLFFFLIFEFPYYCRCNYVHGEKSIFLLAYANDYQLSVLYAAGYFVERFLLEMIPKTLKGEFKIPEEVIADREYKIYNGKSKNYNSNIKKYMDAVDQYFDRIEALNMLKAGDKAPSFTLTDQDGKEHTLEYYRGKKIILYFYSDKQESASKNQASGYAKLHSQFVEKGVVVIGVSRDSVESQKRFQEKMSLPFTLLSDVEKEVFEAYGALKLTKDNGHRLIKTVRTTYLINEEGIITFASNKVKAAADAKHMLAVVANS